MRNTELGWIGSEIFVRGNNASASDESIGDTSTQKTGTKSKLMKIMY